MAMASLTSGLLVRKGHARPSSFKPSSTPFRFENDDAVELLEDTQRLAAQSSAAKPERKKKNPTFTPVSIVKNETKKAKSPAVKTAPKKVANENTSVANNQDVARKTIRIRKDLNITLRVLAARTGMSQKEIVENALANYLEDKRLELDCICGADDL